MSPDADPVIAATRDWLEKAVIGLNLCPFAKAVHAKDQIRYSVTEATTPAELLVVLEHELQHLADIDAHVTDTTVLVHPHVLQNFLDFNDFLADADALLERLGLEGTLQIASFHPHYQFARTRPDNIANYTNRAPFPTLHLLREASIDKAVEAYPDAEAIYERNIEALERVGRSGWAALFNVKPPPTR